MVDDPLLEITDPGAIDAAKELELARINELDDVREILKTERGRRFLWRVVARAGIYRVSFAGDGGTHATAFREGERNMGLWLLAEIQAAGSEWWAVMQKENQG